MRYLCSLLLLFSLTAQAQSVVRGRVADAKDQSPEAPPAILSGDPEQELEQTLRRNPEDPDAKIDVGSDQSMDASDPPSSSQPGQSDKPVPSSSFPEKTEGQ